MVFSLLPRKGLPEDRAKLDELARRGVVRRGAGGVTVRPERVVPTGVGMLDAVLPGGGLPGGYVTELAGPPSCGKLGLAVRALAAALAEGDRAAFVDTSHTFFPATPDLVRALARLLVCRVPSALDGIAAAELLAAGGIGLVVVDLAGAGAFDAATRAALVRLGRAAREEGAAVLAITQPPPGIEGLLGTLAALRVTVSAAHRRVRDGRIDAVVELARSRFGHDTARRAAR